MSGKKFTPFILILILTALTGCQPVRDIQPGNLDSLTGALDRDIPFWLEKYHTPGLSMALVSNGQVVWQKGYGWTDTDSRIPVRPDTIFQIASISKPVTAWGVMRLVEEGKIGLDDPINSHLTRWRLPDSKFNPRQVTIRRLLSHSAGLSVHGYPGYKPGVALPSLTESLSGAQGITYAVRQISAPGSQYRYSGGGYTLLQLMVEDVSGESFARFMQREVIDPLGLENTGFERTADMEFRSAVGYDSEGKAQPDYRFVEQAAAGLYTTAGDLALFGAAALPAGDSSAGRGTLSAQSVKQMLTPTSLMPPHSLETYLSGMDGYGLGYFVETLPDGSRLYSHTGGNRGWRSLLIIAPDQEAVLAVVTNSDNGSQVNDQITRLWVRWLGAGKPVRFIRQDLIAAILGVLAGFSLAGFGLEMLRQINTFRRTKPEFKFHISWPGIILVALLNLSAAVWLLAGEFLVGQIFPDLVLWLDLAGLVWVVYFCIRAFIHPQELSTRSMR